MDLQLYMRVMWRFRLLMLGGILAAIGLAFLSFVRVSPGAAHTFTYRQNEQWVSYSTLFVTQRGFPWGYVTSAYTDPKAQVDKLGARQFADPGRLSSLAILYSQLATSDQVRKIMRRQGPVHGDIQVAPVLAGGNGSDALPLVQIAAIADGRQLAINLAQRQTAAFQEFLQEQQNRNAIPSTERVVVTVVKRADRAKIFTGRSKTLPIVVFFTMMLAVSGLAFVLENMRPRVHPVPSTEAQVAASRRTA